MNQRTIKPKLTAPLASSVGRRFVFHVLEGHEQPNHRFKSDSLRSPLKQALCVRIESIPPLNSFLLRRPVQLRSAFRAANKDSSFVQPSRGRILVLLVVPPDPRLSPARLAPPQFLRETSEVLPLIPWMFFCPERAFYQVRNVHDTASNRITTASRLDALRARLMPGVRRIKNHYEANTRSSQVQKHSHWHPR